MDKQSGIAQLPKEVQLGLKKSLQGEVPFLLSPLIWGAKKIFKPKVVDEVIWKSLQRPVASADIGLGQMAQKGLNKLTGSKGKFFEDKVLLETAKEKAKKSFTGRKEYKVPSILAPAKRLGGFAVPLVGAIKLEDMYRKAKRKGNMDGESITKAELQKTAAMLVHLKDQKNMLQKQAKATELLYKQAELGQIKFPKTLAEYREKVGELLSKDLSVVEEAIKMASSTEDTNSMGALGNQGKLTSAHDAFANSIIGD